MANKRWPADVTIDGTATATKTFGSNPNGDPVFVTRPAGGETLDTVLSRGATTVRILTTGKLTISHPSGHGIVVKKTTAGTGANTVLFQDSNSATEGYVGYGSGLGNPMMHISNAVGGVSYLATSHAFSTAGVERANLSNTGLMIGEGVATQKLELGGVTSSAASYVKVSRNNGNLLMGVNLNENAIYSRTETDAAKNFKVVVGSADALTILANTNATFAATLTCTTLNQTSTRETKNVQGEFEDDALSIIKDLTLHRFTYKNFDQVLKTPEVVDEDGTVTTPAEFERVELPATPYDQLNVGLLYDEVESNPYISTGNGSIQVNNLLFMALKAIQQLEAKNTELTQRIEALEG